MVFGFDRPSGCVAQIAGSGEIRCLLYHRVAEGAVPIAPHGLSDKAGEIWAIGAESGETGYFDEGRSARTGSAIRSVVEAQTASVFLVAWWAEVADPVFARPDEGASRWIHYLSSRRTFHRWLIPLQSGVVPAD